MRRTQVHLHKYPRYVRIRVLESSLVQRASRDNPRGIKPSVILVGGLDRGENQKSPGMAKGGGKDKQESRVARGQPRDSPLGNDVAGNDYPEQASLAQGPTTPTFHSCQLSFQRSPPFPLPSFANLTRWRDPIFHEFFLFLLFIIFIFIYFILCYFFILFLFIILLFFPNFF